uniref:CHCH domain-containing protein n=1 Tax=Xiphophorus couchianus TaxID=32473 RepID=A0A3B5KWQ4_9TELE
MGSGESTTRKVSFGVDDEDRVRILRGIKLSEDVLQRMRGVANIPPESSSSRQQTILKDELAKMAEREREAAREELVKTMSRERQQARKEAEKAKELAQQLQKKDSQLKALDAFYKEQLAQLEQRVRHSHMFHRPAETCLNVKNQSRNTAPVCPGLQAQILSCYKDNKDQTLNCSDLVKEYMQCINAAKKLFCLLINSEYDLNCISIAVSM